MTRRRWRSAEAPSRPGWPTWCRARRLAPGHRDGRSRRRQRRLADRRLGRRCRRHGHRRLAERSAHLQASPARASQAHRRADRGRAAQGLVLGRQPAAGTCARPRGSAPAQQSGLRKLRPESGVAGTAARAGMPAHLPVADGSDLRGAAFDGSGSGGLSGSGWVSGGANVPKIAFGTGGLPGSGRASGRPGRSEDRVQVDDRLGRLGCDALLDHRRRSAAAGSAAGAGHAEDRLRHRGTARSRAGGRSRDAKDRVRLGTAAGSAHQPWPPGRPGPASGPDRPGRAPEPGSPDRGCARPARGRPERGDQRPRARLELPGGRQLPAEDAQRAELAQAQGAAVAVVALAEGSKAMIPASRPRLIVLYLVVAAMLPGSWSGSGTCRSGPGCPTRLRPARSASAR